MIKRHNGAGFFSNILISFGSKHLPLCSPTPAFYILCACFDYSLHISKMEFTVSVLNSYLHIIFQHSCSQNLYLCCDDRQYFASINYEELWITQMFSSCTFQYSSKIMKEPLLWMAKNITTGATYLYICMITNFTKRSTLISSVSTSYASLLYTH